MGCFSRLVWSVRAYERVKKDEELFFALLKAGLWEKEVRLPHHSSIELEGLYSLSQEQSVTGLVAAGIEHLVGFVVPKDVRILFVGRTLQLEQLNNAMNIFIWDLIEKMRCAGIYAILVKGQGIAQCYERPLWRTCGDVDLFLSEDNYEKAKRYLVPLCTSHDEELSKEKHFALTFDTWVVELHGSLPSRISKRADNVLKKIQDSVFLSGSVSPWEEGKNTVFLLHPNENVVYVFTHILKHFFYSGIGLRQICDWCRLLWTSRDLIDKQTLSRRIGEMRFWSEWRVFACLAVDYLDMPSEAMPFYVSSKRIKKKAKYVLEDILQVGNFGRNRDESFRRYSPFLKIKWIVCKRRLKDFISHCRIFPWDSLKVFFNVFTSGIISTLKHEG